VAIWPFRKKHRPPPPSVEGSVAGVIPAAGSSTRMGRSKALLDAGGRSFLAATVGGLVGGGCRPVLVVLADGQEEETRKAVAAGAVPLANPDPGDGPITSIRIALRALPDEVEGIAVLPVDHPLVRPETVQALLAAFRESDAPIVLPVRDGEHGHPGLFRRSVFQELLDEGLEEGARTVVHAHLDEALLVPVEDDGVLTDIDTPEAYAAAFSGNPLS
jgi:CTP:molybdopterin cytidylyltransferase MocA